VTKSSGSRSGGDGLLDAAGDLIEPDVRQGAVCRKAERTAAAVWTAGRALAAHVAHDDACPAVGGHHVEQVASDEGIRALAET
jgi:hypothetical protein